MRMENVEAEQWFYGDLDQATTDALLVKQKPGTFLVRNSSQPGNYAVSVVREDGQIAKALIRRQVEGFQLSDPGARLFPTLTALIQSQPTVLRYPLMKPALANLQAGERGTAFSSWDDVALLGGHTYAGTASPPVQPQPRRALSPVAAVETKPSSPGLVKPKAAPSPVLKPQPPYCRTDTQVWQAPSAAGRQPVSGAGPARGHRTPRLTRRSPAFARSVMPCTRRWQASRPRSSSCSASSPPLPCPTHFSMLM